MTSRAFWFYRFFWAVLGASWGIWKLSWSTLGRCMEKGGFHTPVGCYLGDLLGASWAALGTPTWTPTSLSTTILVCVALFRLSFASFSTLRESLGASWEPPRSLLLGLPWDPLGSLLAALRSLLESLLAFQRHSESILEAIFTKHEKSVKTL